MLSRWFFDFSMVVGAFVIGLSQISSFFSYYHQYLCDIFYDPSVLDSCWYLGSIWRFIYKFLSVSPFDCSAVAGSWKVRPLNLKLTTANGWLFFGPTDHLKSTCNRCEIKRKRKRSDSVLWQKPLHRQKTPKSNLTTQNATKNVDYRTIADRLRTVNWGNDSHPTGVVKPVNGIPTLPFTTTVV